MGIAAINRHCQGKVVVVRGYMQQQACKALINLSEEIGYAEATVSFNSGERMLKNIRNNYRALMVDEQLAKREYQRSQIFLPEYLDGWVLWGLDSSFRFYKYEPGQRFKSHRDGRRKTAEDKETRYSWLLYLNDNYQGGGLVFEGGEQVQPETGMLVVFPHDIKHESLPVAEGEKYVLRSDAIYQKLAEPTSDYASDPAPYDFNEVFCETVAKLFDGFFLDLGYEIVQREREAWTAQYKYKHYGRNVSVLFTYSGYPDGPAYYQILIKAGNRNLPLDSVCNMLYPQYEPLHSQFTTYEQNDYRQFISGELENRLQRHLWEMKMLCIGLLSKRQ